MTKGRQGHLSITMGNRWTLAILQLLSLLLSSAQGAVRCVCTTQLCQQTHVSHCTARSLCYVQFIADSPGGVQGAVVRGCSDTQAPLLCENRRPRGLAGPWPVLLCCRHDWCNKDSTPTIPPSWAGRGLERRVEPNDTVSQLHSQGGATLPPPHSTEGATPPRDVAQEYYDKILDDEFFYETRKKHSSAESNFINPLYIGVPVAGACILLGMVIFAIYILRGHRTCKKPEVRYKNTIRHNGMIYPKYSPGGARVAHAAYCTHPACTAYADSDRSSNGSESRLLDKV